MLVKAIVISMAEDLYSAYITIPIYDNTSSKSDFSNVPHRLASICPLPGCSPFYSPGDVVYVDFENDNQANPVILGCLYREKSSDSSLNLNVSSLKVNVNTHLSTDTSIGNIKYENISTLTNSTDNIKDKVDLAIQTLEKAVTSTLPEVSEDDNGKYLRVIDGKWQAETVGIRYEPNSGGGLTASIEGYSNIV